MGLLSPEIIKARINICTRCRYWDPVSRCLKGHIATSPTGCPIKEFPPVAGAGYASDRPVDVGSPGCSTCKRSLSTMETVINLADTLNRWRRAGFAISEPLESDKRRDICGSCENYDGHRCSICHCIIALKVHIKTANCPNGKW